MSQPAPDKIALSGYYPCTIWPPMNSMNAGLRFLVGSTAIAVYLFVVVSPALAIDLSKLHFEEHPGARGYIYPNERNYLNLAPALFGRTGVLLGVGTFRIFQDASQGDFSHLVAFDYAPGVAEFNREFVRKLKMANSRIHFLCLLMGRQDLAESYREFESGLKPEAEFRGEILRAMDLIYEAERDYRVHQASENSVFLRVVLQRFYFSENAQWNSFLRSDTKFEKLKRLADEGRILVVEGSLSGRQTMKSLASELRRKGLEISALDVSNAYSFIDQAGEIDRYVDNLRLLPFSRDALVLMTHRERNFGEDWDYFAVKATKYMNDLSDFNLRHSDSEIFPPHPLWIRSLKNTEAHLVSFTERRVRCSGLFLFP